MSAAAADARRNNAQHSTGPRTDEGKVRAKLNSVAHGLTAKTLILPGEDPDEYERVKSAFIDNYKPASETELILVAKIAENWWRLQRAYRIERAFLDNRIQLSPCEDPAEAMANMFIDKAEMARFSLFMRYLGSAERAYNKALSDLKAMQKQRRRDETDTPGMEAVARKAQTGTTPSPRGSSFVSQPAPQEACARFELAPVPVDSCEIRPGPAVYNA